ncbi:Fe(3+)-hydroxamate ABC transporter permease FhuB [Mesorhizobium sp. YR577]|uniref:Fe(3+)-hydroxamate ABC transporter permease FhuB n=1 Tax=Mesorhizobium sp. YR577 TaxID=1884373 RepID=UPI0008E256ED|nr:Fe(3+)-hydroxamate ABC transporter permease FhuB [Mesorhizobium sp. YR577]SFU15667.1 iron complex transport system permease protein [Mesorhizobium sp. YR577]
MTDLAIPRTSGNRAAFLGNLLLLLSLALLALNLRNLLPVNGWMEAFVGFDPANLTQLMARDVLMPRFVMSLLCGGALGLAGLVFQQVLRNPLAEPGTLGVFAGAKCALAIAILWAPGALALGWDIVAFAGGMIATLVVLLLASRQGFSPLSVILAGLILSLSLNAFGSMLTLVHFEALSDLYNWEAGSLVQNNWKGVQDLLPRLGLVLLATVLMTRPLTLLDLEEGNARSVGLSLATVRTLAIVIAVVASGFVAGAVGVIGFIGLAGPAIARHAGARRFRDRLLAGPLISAGLLALTDQGLVFVSGGMEIPAGAVTAVVGAPLLIWLMRTIRSSQRLPQTSGAIVARQSCDGLPVVWIIVALATLAVVISVALAVGRLPEGWHIALGDEFGDLVPWRLPRVTAALASGVMLAIAGMLMQRMTGNGLASPEMLGISSGAAIILLLVTFLLPPLDRITMMGLSSLGAGLVLVMVLWLSRRSGFSPEHLLLTGVALSTVLGSTLTFLVFIGDVRVLHVLNWLSGSTYSVTATDAMVICFLAAGSLVLVPFLARWLAILPLGAATSTSLGLSLRRSRLVLLLATAALTGTTTLIVGPLSFVGLMAPHMARLLGIRRPIAQTYVAATIGALLMVLADWIGRTIAFPWQIPAGLIATMLGGTYFVALSFRR